MAKLTERHEVKIQGKDKTIIFTANSEDGRLIISQLPEGKRSKELCSITLADPDELRDFFPGLQRIVSSLEHVTKVVTDRPASPPRTIAATSGWRRTRRRDSASTGEKRPGLYSMVTKRGTRNQRAVRARREHSTDRACSQTVPTGY
jgi:hypothetical protein